MDIVTAIITSGLTVVGMLGGLFFVFFKILKGAITDIRSDNIRLEARLSGDMSKLDTKLSGEIKAVRDELKGDIKDLSIEVRGLAERVNRMDGQLYQVTQMLYLKPPDNERHNIDDVKEN